MNGYKLWISAACYLLLAGANLALADSIDVETVQQAETEASISAGYRATSVHGAPGRAREFDSLEASPLFKARLFTDRGPYRLDLGFDYRNEDDYAAEAYLDTQGLLRLDLHSQRFFHNLDHIPYNNGLTGGESFTPPLPPFVRTPAGPPAEGSRPDGTFNGAVRAYYTDQDPGDKYGLRLDINEARLKIKCPDYPAHVTLSYWRYEKQGEKQLRFAGENCTTACHMQSKTRDIDRVTEEVKAAVDAHIGYIDVVLEGLFRTFRDHEPIPTDDFGTHNITGGKTFLAHQHDEDPDSKLKEVTLRLNTAPSGGFVASAAFTIGERENQSDLTSVAPVEAETDYYRASADATYTPSQNWTFNLRYRLLDMDSDNTGYFRNYYLTGTPDMRVREALDITRAWYEAIASYRPAKSLTLKAELRREEIERSNTGVPSTTHSGFARRITDTWDLPDEEVITRVKLGFSSRLLEKSSLKLSGWLAVQKNDDPAYGTSYGDGQEIFLAGNYTPSPLWGLQANLNLLKQENNDFEIDQIYSDSIDREKEQQNFSMGAWVNPREGLSFDLNYGYFRTGIDQSLFFGSNPAYIIPRPGDDVEADFRQTVQSVTAGVTWQALDNLSCRLEGYHIRSKADFDPDFAYILEPAGYFPNGANADSADLKDISKVDIRQNGVRGRVNWQVDERLSCGVEVTFDDYDEVGNDVFDGSAQTYMASLTYTF